MFLKRLLHNGLALLLYVVVCSSINGCASLSLWENHKYAVAKKEIQAEAIQIYSSYDKTLVNGSWCYQRKFSIQFKVKNDTKTASDILILPGIMEGFLIVKDTGGYVPDVFIEEMRAKDKKIKTLFENSEINISSIYASKCDDVWQLNIAFTSKNKTLWETLPSTIEKLKEVPPNISNYKYPVTFSSNRTTGVNDNISYYYRLPCCGGKTETQYTKDLDLKGWTPVLPVQKVPLPMSFYQIEPEIVYENSQLSRSLLTPFAVVADTATFPLQLIFLLAWNQSGPR